MESGYWLKRVVWQFAKSYKYGEQGSVRTTGYFAGDGAQLTLP
jgi:hypothetical protein